MVDYLDDLAAAAAEALVSAMVTDSWEALKCRFVQLVGHEWRMDAAHEQITAAAEPLRDQAWLGQKQAWRTRFRDMLDDDLVEAQSLRALLADLNAVPAQAVPASQHTMTGHRSQAVNLGGGINGNRGEVFVGVGTVDKRKTNYGLAPLMFVIGSAKKVAGARPVAATVITATVLTAGTATAWRTHWPTTVFGEGGATSHPRQAGRVFGDSYSRWQVRVPDQVSTAGSVTFLNGLVLVSETSTSGAQVTAYREDTGKAVWTNDFASAPVVAGNLLLAATYPDSLSAYRFKTTSSACPSAVSRINPATGQTLWTSGVAGTRCGNLTASAIYVVCGGTVLSASDGAVMEQLPTAAEGWAFRRDILVRDGSVLSLEILHAGRLRSLWRRDTAGYVEVVPEPRQIVLVGPESYPDSAAKVELLNATNGALSGSITGTGVMPTPDGVYAYSPSGKILFCSVAGTRTWRMPKEFIYFSGGILWGYRSPNGYSTRSVYAYAMIPDSLRPLGRLVTTPAQVSLEGNDSFVVSDGKYAAIVAAPIIYVFNINGQQ